MEEHPSSMDTCGNTSASFSSILSSLRLLHEAYKEYQFAFISSAKETGSHYCNSNNFLKGSKWSPDGKIVLSASEDSVLRLYATPQTTIDSLGKARVLDTFEASEDKSGQDAVVSTLLPWIEVEEGETIYDFCWFPLMDWLDASSCYFATVSRDQPIHLYNPQSGDCLSYLPVDATESLMKTISLSFHPTGHRLYGGSYSTICVYDVSRPGPPIQVSKLSMRRSKGTQRGIISCFAFQSIEGFAQKLIACGSYGKSIFLYDEEGDFSQSAIQLYDNATVWGGVTQLKWVDENTIVSGHRGDCFLRLWDIRNPSKVLTHFQRITAIQQRFTFDIFANALYTGDQYGYLSSYSLKAFRFIEKTQLHQQSPLTSATFHPTLPLLLTSSGTKDFTEFERIGKNGESDSDEAEAHSVATDVIKTSQKESDFENYLRIWSFSAHTAVEE